MPKAYGPDTRLVRYAKLDGRTAPGREFIRTCRSLYTLLGGVENIKPEQRVLIEKLAEMSALSKMLFAKIVQEDGEASVEAHRKYNWYANNIRRYLEALGLKPEGPGTGTPRKKVTVDPKKDAPPPTPALHDLMGQQRKRDNASRPI